MPTKKKTVEEPMSFEDLLIVFRDGINAYLDGSGAAPEEADEEGDDGEGMSPEVEARFDELMKKRIDTLKKMALALEFDEDEVTNASKEDLAESVAKAELEDAEDEDEGEEEAEEAEEGEDEEERERLMGLTLVRLKSEAKAAGLTPADIKGLDKEGLVDLILDQEEEPEEEDEEDEEIDDPEDWETETLNEYSLAELKQLAVKYDLDPKGKAKAALIKFLQDN